jgi:hypothetical protein
LFTAAVEKIFLAADRARGIERSNAQGAGRRRDAVALNRDLERQGAAGDAVAAVLAPASWNTIVLARA